MLCRTILAPLAFAALFLGWPVAPTFAAPVPRTHSDPSHSAMLTVWDASLPDTRMLSADPSAPRLAPRAGTGAGLREWLSTHLRSPKLSSPPRSKSRSKSPSLSSSPSSSPPSSPAPPAAALDTGAEADARRAAARKSWMRAAKAKITDVHGADVWDAVRDDPARIAALIAAPR